MCHRDSWNLQTNKQTEAQQIFEGDLLLTPEALKELHSLWWKEGQASVTEKTSTLSSSINPERMGFSLQPVNQTEVANHHSEFFALSASSDYVPVENFFSSVLKE